MTSKTTTPASDAYRQAVLDVLARGPGVGSRRRRGVRGRLHDDASVIQPGVYQKDREEIRTTMAAAFAGPLSGSRWPSAR
jgi:hypothetical protein